MSTDSCLYFIYLSLKNHISRQILDSWSESDLYMQGQVRQGDVFVFRTFRKDRVIGFYKTEEELNAAFSNIDLADYPTSETKPHPVHTFDVHFTGFKKADKQILIELAESKEMVVRKDVTKYLNLLCYGYNASQRKLDLARQQGVIIVNQPEFTHFVDTGEIPDFE